MATRLYSRIAMLGAVPETRGAIAAVVDAYRSHGLLKRWPVTYIATHGDGAPARKLALAAKATREFTALLARERRMVVHVHVSAGAGFLRGAALMGGPHAPGAPILPHLPSAGFAARIRRF